MGFSKAAENKIIKAVGKVLSTPAPSRLVERPTDVRPGVFQLGYTKLNTDYSTNFANVAFGFSYNPFTAETATNQANVLLVSGVDTAAGIADLCHLSAGSVVPYIQMGYFTGIPTGTNDALIGYALPTHTGLPMGSKKYQSMQMTSDNPSGTNKGTIGWDYDLCHGA